MSFKVYIFAVTGCVVSCGIAEMARAQTAAAPSVDALEEVIVTAQRRSEDVQRAALNVDVISQQSLSLTGASRATDIGAMVPSLQISESGNSQQSLYLRSVGTFSANAYSDPAVSFNVDGVAIGRPSSMTGVLYDLRRVEVLKGPQGTLYGRNATGGAINVIPNPPKLGETSAEVALSVGNYASVHPEGSANFALGESSAARLAFTYNRHDGYQSDETGDARGYGARAQYLYKPGENLDIRLSVDFAHDGGRGPGGTIIALQDPFTGAVTASPLSRNVGTIDPRSTALIAGQYSFISGRFYEGIQGAPQTDNNFWGASSEINWHTPLGTLTVLPAYRHAKLDVFSTGFAFGSNAFETDRQTSVEARLASEDSGLIRWLIGAYYFDERIRANYQFNQQALSPIQDFDTGTKSNAGFLRLTLAPLDKFRISGGVRYTEDKKDLNGASRILISACTVQAAPPACPGAPLAPKANSIDSLIAQLQLFPIFPNALYGSTLPGAQGSIFPLITKAIDKEAKTNRVTWHLGVEYDVAQDSLLYASWDSGYHAGGFAFAEIKPTYAPEYISAYSIGSKNRFFNGRLQLNAEAFYWKYTDQQIPHGGSDSDGAYVFYTDNAGSSKIKGAELSVKYLAASHTMFSAEVQYLSAVYDSFTFQTPAGGTNQPPLTGCPFSQTDATHYTINCAGRTAQQSPRWAGNVGVQQTFNIGDYSLIGDVNAHLQSESVVGFEMIPVETQKSYTITNVSLALVPSGDKWLLAVFGNNLGDERPLGTAYYNSVMGVIGAGVGAPRTFGVRGAYKF
jgi:iron complex outermembrane recepter protein